MESAHSLWPTGISRQLDPQPSSITLTTCFLAAQTMSIYCQLNPHLIVLLVALTPHCLPPWETKPLTQGVLLLKIGFLLF